MTDKLKQARFNLIELCTEGFTGTYEECKERATSAVDSFIETVVESLPLVERHDTIIPCSKHPKYVGRGQPLELCEACWDIYAANNYRLAWYINLKGHELYEFAKGEGAREEREKMKGVHSE